MNENQILANPVEKSFIGEFGKYTLLDTADGNWSVKSELHDELSHSIHGAYLETVHCYFNSTKLLEKLREKRSITILEIGFGLGLAFEYLKFFLWNELNNENGFCVNYIGLEIEPKMVDFRAKHVKNLHVKDKKEWVDFDLVVLIGDALDTIDLVRNNSVDIVFQDPFCLKSNVTLWEEGWFKKLNQKMVVGGLLGTFSASTQVKERMERACLFVERGIPFNRKKGHLIARK